MWEGRWMDVDTPIRTVAIVGGTHGNELNGVYLQRALKKVGVRARGFEVILVEGNSESVKLNQRYVDKDLNRCFLQKDLEEQLPATVEQRRAQELNSLLGPKASKTPHSDFIIDLHNTTANTGVALMMHPRDKFSHALSAHLQTIDPSVRICNWADEEPMMLPSMGRSGITFEVGPAPWGVVVPELFSNSLRLLHAALSYIAAHNASLDGTAPLPLEDCMVDVYSRIRPMGFPRGEGRTVEAPSNAEKDGDDIAAMLHPSIHGGDFRPLRIGDPIFVRWDGSEILFEGPENGEDLTFFFANEAAYYEKNIAFILAKRKRTRVKRLLLS